MEVQRRGNYLFDHEIGRGSFSTVWFCRHYMLNVPVAIKVIDKITLITKEANERHQREIEILKATNHPYIASLFECFEDDSNIYLVMEFAGYENLLKLINTSGRIPENKARKYFFQISSAVEYLHEKHNILHRDIKCENILIDQYDNVKLIDFGLSNFSRSEEFKVHTICGSPSYSAPELLMGLAYTSAVDIWSMGVVLFTMVAGALPFHAENLSRLIKTILYVELAFPNFFSANLCDLLQKMLMKDFRNRLPIKKIQNHPWITKGDSIRVDQILSISQEDEIDAESVAFITKQGFKQEEILNHIKSKTPSDFKTIYNIVSRMNFTRKIFDILESNKRNQGQRKISYSTEEVKILQPLTLPEPPKRIIFRPKLHKNLTIGKEQLKSLMKAREKSQLLLKNQKLVQ